jgi:hypothetical protein
MRAKIHAKGQILIAVISRNRQVHSNATLQSTLSSLASWLILSPSALERCCPFLVIPSSHGPFASSAGGAVCTLLRTCTRRRGADAQLVAAGPPEAGGGAAVRWGVGVAMPRGGRRSAHDARAQHRADTAAAIERYAARSRALREGGANEDSEEAAAPGADASTAAPPDPEAGAPSGPPERLDLDLEMEMELARRRRAARGTYRPEEDRYRHRRAAMEQQDGMPPPPRRAPPGMYGFGDRPPPNCPAQVVLCWMGCQILILIDIVNVPSNCITVPGRDQCITCEIGADLDYSSCGLPWPGPSPEAMPAGAGSYAETQILDFYNSCCREHPECCTPRGSGFTFTSSNAVDTYTDHARGDSAHPQVGDVHDPFIKAMVKGVPCCDAFCGAHDVQADGGVMSDDELMAQELAENFYCDGFTYWYLSYFGVYIASVIVVGNAAKNDGSTSACITLSLGVLILYWVRTRIVPAGVNRHSIVYPAVPFFEYAVMSDLFLWMMTRRARALRLHYERTTRHIDRVADLEAARLRDREELDRVAEQLAQRPVEPIPPVKPIALGTVGAIVEGIAMDDMNDEDRLVLGEASVTSTANPMMRASVSVGSPVNQRELEWAAGSDFEGDEGVGPLHVASSAVVIQPPSSTGDAVGGAAVTTVVGQVTPRSSLSHNTSSSSSSSSSSPREPREGRGASHGGEEEGRSGGGVAVVEGIAERSRARPEAMAAVEDDADDDLV